MAVAAVEVEAPVHLELAAQVEPAVSVAAVEVEAELVPTEAAVAVQVETASLRSLHTSEHGYRIITRTDWNCRTTITGRRR